MHERVLHARMANDRSNSRRQDDRPRPRARTSSEPGQGRSRSGSETRTRSSQADGAGRRTTGTRTTGQRRKPPSRGRQTQVRRHPTRPRAVAWKRVAVVVALLGVAVAIGGCAWLGSVATGLPDPDIRGAKGRDQSTVIYARDGKTVLAQLFAEQNRTDVPLAQIPLDVREGVIATEDRRFYGHKGVDPLGIARALMIDITTGSTAQGGSTITQQYVKNAFVTQERTLKRKVQEAMLAYEVERNYSKDQILELYLNTIYFGHGAYGVESASQAYFGKSVTELTLPESAMIAGVIKSPGRYSPYLDPGAARKRRDTVLAQMLDAGYVTAPEHVAAAATPVTVAGLKSSAVRAPYFVEWVKERLARAFGSDRLYRGGLRVVTTIDPAMQTAAEKAVADTFDRPTDPSAALVALSPVSGEVLAMVGGRDFKSQQFNVAVQGSRQPGSAFKPFVFATALEEKISSEATFSPAPATFKTPSGPWKVSGASSGGGPMRLREAMEQSVNSVFAALILKVGPDNVVDTAERLGLRKGIVPVPAIALGGLAEGVSPLEMATAYGTLAAAGKRAESHGIVTVTDPKGNVLFKATTKTTRAVSPAVAYITTDVLKGVIAKGTGTSAAIGRPAAGKTGTTQEYRDAWFVGYTPQVSCAVWVGYPEGAKEMKSVRGRAVTGGSFPAKIWASFMKSAHAKLPKQDFTRPADVVTASVCEQTGQASTAYCPAKVQGLFPKGALPDTCETHAAPVKVTLPKLVGLAKAAALALLERLGLGVKVTEEDVAGVAAGVVARQTPPAGSAVTSQTVVTIVVSTGGTGNKAPDAKVAAPREAAVGQGVNFDGSGSKDDGRITAYLWEFGDGSTATGAQVTHPYTRAGDFEVVLWVTDDHGQQSSASHTISIR